MAKKSFKDNPALNFITPPAAPPRTKAAPADRAPLKLEPRYVETKSKRVQLLMQPSLHLRLKSAAEADGRSLNDLVHAVLSDWTEAWAAPGPGRGGHGNK